MSGAVEDDTADEKEEVEGRAPQDELDGSTAMVRHFGVCVFLVSLCIEHAS